MARWAIYACEQMYGGLHGMHSVSVIETDDEAEVMDCAREQSYEVMDSYSEIYDSLEEEIRYCLEEYEEYGEDEVRDMVYSENVDYAYHLLNENAILEGKRVSDYTTRELESMCYDFGYDEFVKLTS